MTDPIQRAQPKFRRVVTGHDAEGKPIIWIDGEATNHKFPSDHISSTMMWSTNSSPTRFSTMKMRGPAFWARPRRLEAAGLR